VIDKMDDRVDDEEPLLSERGSINVNEPEYAKEDWMHETTVKQTANKKDIFLMVFINFLSFVCFAIVLPSLWPYLDSFHQNKSMVGWAVAVNSAGTFLASPVLGKWADKRGVREAIFVSLIVMIIGNLLYSISMNVWVLLVARFIVGCAAANYAPASAYLSYATSEENRTLVMGINSAAGILGFILGPAMAAGLAFLPRHVVYEWFAFNGCTYPGYASVVLSLFCLLFLPTFNDIQANKVPTVPLLLEEEGEIDLAELSSYFSSEPNNMNMPITNQQIEDGDVIKSGDVRTPKIATNPMASASVSSIQSLRKLAQPKSQLPTVSIIVCLYLQFVFYTAFTIFETIGTPYTQDHYNWSVTENGLLFAGIGGACIVALAVLQMFAMCLRDRALLIGTEVLMIAGFGVLINYPFDASVDLPRFLIGVAAASIGFSAACALIIAIFSKILEDQEQGLMMGYLSTAGSAARMIGPVGASYVLNYVGGSLVFLIVVGMLISSLFFTIVFYTKLITKGKMDFNLEEGRAAMSVSEKKQLHRESRRLRQEIRKKKRDQITFAVNGDT